MIILVYGPVRPPHPVADESVYLAVGGNEGHGLALVAKLLEGIFDGRLRNPRI